MDEKKRSTEQDWIDPDDAPDLSTPYWQEIVLAEPVSRGRPRIPNPPIARRVFQAADFGCWFYLMPSSFCAFLK